MEVSRTLEFRVRVEHSDPLNEQTQEVHWVRAM